MYRNISGMTESQWNDAVTNAGRYVLTKAVFNGDTTLYGDGTDGAVVSIKFDEQMENSNGLSMGGTIASQCKVEIRQPSTPISLVNSTFVPYVGLKDSANREGYVPLGEFFATSADSNSNGGVVSVVGYDRFCKLEVPYEPTVSFPTTTTAIMADLAANRFTFSGTITDRPIDEFRVGTVKDWIGWLAGLEGKNARFNRDGQLEFVYYDITQYDYTVDRENQYMAGVNTKTADNVTINAITSGTEENPIVSGSGRSITFSNPYMTQEILDDIRNTEIVDSLTEVSGELITVDAIEAPAKSVEVNIKPYQNLNGYDHPWAGGAGVNKLPYNSSGPNTFTRSGITVEVNNGVFTISGTATAGDAINYPLTQSVDLSPSTNKIAFLNSVADGNLTVAFKRESTTVHYWVMTPANRIASGWTDSGNEVIDTVSIQWNSSLSISGSIKVSPMLIALTETNPTSYIPYENICPIYPANGINLINYINSRTSNGITFSYDPATGGVTLSGTATGNAYSDGSISAATVQNYFYAEAGTYVYSMNGYQDSSGVPRFYIQAWYDDNSNELIVNSIRYGAFTLTKSAWIYVRIQVLSGHTMDGTIYPMIRRAEIASFAYVPHKSFGVLRMGKNVLPPQLSNGTSVGVNYMLNVDGSVTVSGTSTNGNSGKDYEASRYRPPNGTYTISGGTTDVGVRINRYTKDGTIIDRVTSYGTPLQIVIDDNVGYIWCGVGYISANKTVDTTIYPQLELGATATAYEPYQGEVFSNVGDQDYYGGTLNVNTGLLTVTHKGVDLVNWMANWSKSTSYPGGFYRTASNFGFKQRTAFICSHAKNVTNINQYAWGTCYCDSAINIRIMPEDATVNDWYAYIQAQHDAGTPIMVCAELLTPEVYQLTPTQVELLKGTNNIWADNSTLNVIYLAIPRANMSFRPMELQWRGNPCVQCGDRIFVETETNSLTALVMAHTLSIEGGMNDVIRCFGSSDAEIALDKSPMEKKISAAYNALQSAIQDATALLNGTRGGIFEITKENGINTGWLIKESASPNYMGNVIIANYNGIGFSTDGGATYGTAITTDGHINGQYITAHSVDVEALSVGNTSDPFSNYVYIGRRRPNDDNTDMVIRIGVASQSMVQEMRGNRTSIYKTEDVQAYVNGSLTDAQLDARALMYYSDTDYVLLNLGSFRIGGMLMQAQANGGVKFIKAE